MFVLVNSADKKRKPVRIAVNIVAEYREFVPGEGKNDVKSIIIFKKSEAKPDLHSSDTVDELDLLFNPLS